MKPLTYFLIAVVLAIGPPLLWALARFLVRGRGVAALFRAKRRRPAPRPRIWRARRPLMGDLPHVPKKAKRRAA